MLQFKCSSLNSVFKLQIQCVGMISFSWWKENEILHQYWKSSRPLAIQKGLKHITHHRQEFGLDVKNAA